LSSKELADYAKLQQQVLAGKGKSGSGSGSGDESGGYNIAEDVYATSLAKGSGMEYFPQEGIDPNLLS
jgi:hypothetical protein